MVLITSSPFDMKLKNVQEEKGKKLKEKVEDCLHTIIKVARDEDLGEQIGKEVYFDLVNHDKVCTFCIEKQMPFTQFKEEFAKAFYIPVQFQRYWLWIKRHNHTYRPDRALTAQEEIQTVDQLRKMSNKGKEAELKLFLEVELCLDLRPISGGGKTIKEEILLFFKLYDPLEENIRYVGRLFVKGNAKLLEILSKLKEFAGFSPNEEIELFEEIRFYPSVMCEKIDSTLSFHNYGLEDGGIICFQKSLQNQWREQYRFPEVRAFLEYVRNQQKEQEEKEENGKGKAEAGLYTMIKVARDEDFGEQIGKEIYFDLVDYDKVHTFCIQQQMAFTQFKEVAKAFGIPVQFQRYWLWVKRPNQTYRPDRALTAQEEIQSVNEVRAISNKRDDAELKLYLEVELCLNLRPAPPENTNAEILLFFKLYDPLKENIRYVGRLFVKGSGTPLEILSKLKEFAGFSPNEEIELFEEIKFTPSVMCEKIDSTLSFSKSLLENGDIICFQKSLRDHCSKEYRFPDVPSFLEYVHNRQPKEHEMPVPGSDFPTKRPRLNRVVPEDSISTAESRVVDDAASPQFTWTVHNFSRLNVENLYSDEFTVGGYKWRVLIFPKGDKVDYLSVYLDVANSTTLPNGWSIDATFSLAVVDQIHGKFTLKRDTQHSFTATEDDFGYNTFMPLTELNDPGRGYLVGDKLIIQVDITFPNRH